jgi:phage anti-repressor protein
VSNTPKNREYYVNLLWEYQQQAAKWINQIWSSEPDDDYEKCAEYVAARDYYRSFQMQEGVDYGVVIDYARELSERHEKTDKALDEKADAIIKYLGGGSSLITFGALLSLKADTPQACALGMAALLSLIPSLYFAVRAVSAALHVRRPRASAIVPHVKFAVEMAEFNKTKEKTELNVWLIFHPICEAMFFRNLQKAKWVESAHNHYRKAIACLGVPVVVISCCLLVNWILLTTAQGK